MARNRRRGVRERAANAPTIVRDWRSGWMPVTRYPTVCGLPPCCADLEPDEFIVPNRVGEFIPTFYTSVCPREHRKRRPDDTFEVRVRQWSGGGVDVVISDDDDAEEVMAAGALTPGGFDALTRWIGGLVILDPDDIRRRVEGV